MPKIYNTKKQRSGKLKERLTLDHIFNKTSIFENRAGVKEYDPETVGQIKKNLKLYWESWIEDDLQELVWDRIKTED